MKTYKLTVQVPESVDTETLQSLLGAAIRSHGITITVPREARIDPASYMITEDLISLDVDLVDVEAVGLSLLQEVPS